MNTRFAGASRRQIFLGAGASLGLAATTLSRAAVSGSRNGDAPWIPSTAFMREELPLFMKLATVPAVSIAVVEEGVVAWAQTVGVSNTETMAPAHTDTPFEAASMGKPLFAYVVMKLIDERLLELDKPLVHYRPRPSFLAADDPNIEKVTVRDVLRHSTGLPNWVITPDVKTGIVPPARTAFVPGTQYGYSGTAIFWLEVVAEAITGVPFNTMMKARLFDPAGIQSATYAWTEERSRLCAYSHAVVAVPGEPGRYVAKPDPKQVMRRRGDFLLPIAQRIGKPISDWKYEDMLHAAAEGRPFDPLAPTPDELLPNAAYGLTCTASDYAKCLILMMEGRTPASWEISERSRQQMLTPQLNTHADLTFFGLGWGVEKRIAGGMLFGHGGSNGGMQCISLADAQRRRAIVVMSNSTGGWSMNPRIVRAATGMDPFSLYE